MRGSRQWLRAISEAYRLGTQDPGRHLLTILIIAFAYIGVLLFVVLWHNMTMQMDGMIDSLSLKVVVRRGMAGIVALGESLRRLPGVREATFVLRNEDLAGLGGVHGGDDGSVFHVAPLEYFSVKTHAIHPESLAAVASRAHSLRGVEDVLFPERLAAETTNLVWWMRMGWASIGTLVFLLVFLVLCLRTRIEVLEQRQTIQVMRALGASSFFMIAPGVMLGGIRGFLASVAACLGGHAAMAGVASRIGDCVFLSRQQMFLCMLFGTIICSAIPLVAWWRVSRERSPVPRQLRALHTWKR